MTPLDEIKSAWLLVVTGAIALLRWAMHRAIAENDKRHDSHAAAIERLSRQVQHLEATGATKANLDDSIARLEQKLDAHAQENREERHSLRDALQALSVKLEVLIARQPGRARK